MERPERTEKQGIQVIARAAAILRVLKGQPSGLSLGQIAERVALPRSTVQRIVAALQAEQLVVPASREGGIRLGPELRVLAEAARLNLVERLHPLLRDLSEQTGETVDLALLKGRELVFIDQIPGNQRLRAVSSVGESFPLANTANGKAALALLPESEAQKLICAELGERLDQQEAERQGRALMAALIAIRQRGYAIDAEDHTNGISAIGSAFRTMSGSIYAISVPVPTSRFECKKRQMITELLRLAQPVSELAALA